MIAMLIGVPGSGRHTQGAMLCKHWNIDFISLRDLIHHEIINNTEHGQELAPYIHAGKEVPNKLIYNLYNKTLSNYDFSRGLVFTGFPVSLEQYNILNNTLKKLNLQIDEAILLDVPTDESIRRLAGRLICSNCNFEYHVDYKPPQVNGICDECTQRLRTFENDNPLIAAKRVDWFRDISASLITELECKNMLTKINGVQSVESIHREISEKLGFKA